MKKTCYVCLPITGQENTAIARANIASAEIKRLGMLPLTPMEINDESQETLDDEHRPIEFFMGNDVRALIGKCQAIYICKGWESSKGCCVEVECAKQYDKEIFYEEIPISMSFKDTVLTKFRYLLQEYRATNEIYGPGSFEVSLIKTKIDEYKKFFNKYFNWKEIYINDYNDKGRD